MKKAFVFHFRTYLLLLVIEYPCFLFMIVLSLRRKLTYLRHVRERDSEERFDHRSNLPRRGEPGLGTSLGC